MENEMETTLHIRVYFGGYIAVIWTVLSPLERRHEGLGSVLVWIVQVAELLPKLGWSCDVFHHKTTRLRSFPFPHFFPETSPIILPGILSLKATDQPGQKPRNAGCLPSHAGCLGSCGAPPYE